MKKLLLSVILLVPFLAISQNKETRKLDAFTEVSVSQSIKLTLIKGSANTVEIITDGDLEDVITDVSDEQLTVKKKSSWGIGNSDKVEVIVTYTEQLDELSASSSSYLEINDRLVTDDLEISASSSASIKLVAKADDVEISVSSSATVNAEIYAFELDATITSSGSLYLEGNCDELEASASSSGDLKANDFSAKRAELTCTSSAAISVFVQDRLNASASSSGRIKYGGQPKNKSVETSSGGQIAPMD